MTKKRERGIAQRIVDRRLTGEDLKTGAHIVTQAELDSREIPKFGPGGVVFTKYDFSNVVNVNQYLLDPRVEAISGIEFVFSGTNINDEGLKALNKKAGVVTSLDIFRCASITDQGVTHILNECKALEFLCMSNMKGLTGEFEGLKTCDNLKTLIFRGITDDRNNMILLKLLCQLPVLEKLDISFSQISNTHLLMVAEKCPELKSLHIAKCYPFESDHGTEQKADAGLRGLAQICVRLKEINLCASDIVSPDAVKEVLQNHRNIVSCNVDLCGFSREQEGKIKTILTSPRDPSSIAQATMLMASPNLGKSE